MASSSHWKALSSSMKRFNDYLNGIQEEFELHWSSPTSVNNSSRERFNICLGNLRGEFNLMSLEIESLRKQRDEYKEQVEDQMKEWQDVGHNFVCEQCGIRTTSTSQVATSSISKAIKTKTTPSLFPSAFYRFISLDKSGTSRGVNPTQEATTHRSTQRSTLLQKLHSVITPTRPSQSVSHSVTKCQATSSADSQNVAVLSHLSQDYALTAPGQHVDGSIKFNDEVEKEFDVEITQTLFHRNMIGCVKFSRDGKYLAAGCVDGKHIYDVQTGTLTCVLRNLLATEEDPIEAVCFSPDGKYLATGSWDGQLNIWKLTDKYVRNAFKGHTHFIYSLDFSPNGRLLVSSSDDNTVRLWNMRDGAIKFLTDNNPLFLDEPCYTSALFSPNGLYVAASHRDGVVKMWGVRTGQFVRRVRADMGLISDGWDGYWDVSFLDSTRFYTGPQATGERTRQQQFIGHEGFVYSLAISPDGRWIASGSDDRSVRIWDTRNVATQCILNHDDWVYSVDFSPAGIYLASGCRNGVVKIWRYSCLSKSET